MPGVPPNAVDSLKKAFKGLFKRGKKNKQEQDTSTQEQTQPTTTTSSAAAAASSTEPLGTTTSAQPPQLPPVQNASPLQSPTEEGLSKPLPPTHPLLPGPQTQPQEAAPGPTPSTGAAVTPMGAEDFMKEQNKTSQLNHSIPAEGAKDDLGPAIQNSDPLASPQTTTQHLNVASANESVGPNASPVSKNDSAMEATRVEDQVVAPDTLSKENTIPSTHVIPAPTTTPTTADTAEDKVPILQEEPPPIKAVKAAPGMSATSGPLEDFPEGGVPHENDENPTSSTS